MREFPDILHVAGYYFTWRSQSGDYYTGPEEANYSHYMLKMTGSRYYNIYGLIMTDHIIKFFISF